MRTVSPNKPSEGPRRVLKGGLLAAVGVVALASLVIELGVHTTPKVDRILEGLDLVIAGLFALDLVLDLARNGRRAFRYRWYEVVLFFIFVLSLGLLTGFSGGPDGILGRFHGRSLTKLYLALIQFYLGATLTIAFLRAHERLLNRKLRPGVVLIGGFALLVLFGTLGLLLPRATVGPGISFLDALFTATSASCVTGLVVLDTGKEFTTLGQGIIFLLFQVGGLGILSFVVFTSVLSGRQLSLPQKTAMRDVLNAHNLADVRKHVLVTVLAMVLIESIGALSLYFSAQPGALEGAGRWWWSVFHSVSAFCNAGFALQADSLVRVSSAWSTNLTVMTLIVLGGLGTPVLRDLARLGRDRVSLLVVRLRYGRIPIRRTGPPPRLHVQSKLALAVTAGLILLGWIGFYLIEADHQLAGTGTSESILTSLFQSVTTRTAGFNTLATGELQEGSQLLMIFLMAIGASPVSTGGGIKTVAFAILLFTLRSYLRGRENVEAFGRTLPRRVTKAAVSLFVLYGLTVLTITFVLSLTEPALALKDLVFEAVSALSTVGLSTGITEQLSPVGKLLICAAMFIGRVGPLTLVLSVFRSPDRPTSYQYPEQSVILG